MPRIGRQIPHFELVDLESVEAVFSTDRRYRYLLSLSYSDTLLDSQREKTAVVLLKNPSAADDHRADATIRKVETFIYHRFPDVRTLYILNIFAFRATEPGDLNALYLKSSAMEVIGEENDHVIRKAVENCAYLILAWGNSSGIDRDLYEERIYRVKQLLHDVPRQNIFQISGMKQTIHPLHGLMWGYDYKIQNCAKYLDQE